MCIRPGPALVAPEVELDLIARDAAQPVAEGVAGAVAAEGGQAGGDAGEDLLGNVLDLGGRAVGLPAPEQRQRPVRRGQARRPAGRWPGRAAAGSAASAVLAAPHRSWGFLRVAPAWAGCHARRNSPSVSAKAAPRHRRGSGPAREDPPCPATTASPRSSCGRSSSVTWP